MTDPGRRKTLAILGGIGAAIAAGYLLGRLGGGTPSPTTTSTVREALETAVEKAGLEPLKAFWVYVGPVGDMGWSYEHDQGRKYVEEVLGKKLVETGYVEQVPEDRVGQVIDDAVAKGNKLIFTTSFGYMDPTNRKAGQYPDVLFGHCSGYKRLYPNVVTYFAEAYQAYYLNGILAGAMTKTGKVGYVAAHFIPEVIRHINAFALGVREGAKLVGRNPNEVKVIVRGPLGAWFAPDKARAEAEVLISQGVDVIAFTEDSTAIVTTIAEYYTQGKRVYTFSHYSDMRRILEGDARNAVLAGQIVDWGPLYLELVIRAILARLVNPEKPGNTDIWSDFPPATPRDYWWDMRMGVFDIAPPRESRAAYVKKCGRIPDVYDERNELKEYMGCLREVEEEIIREYISKDVPEEVLEYVLKRRREILDGSWDPFTGPIRDSTGRVRIPEGMRASHDQLWNMDWFVEGVVKA
ncbi:BMP family ABC transporter substrate-binding protein [Pyrolobus fumarii]|uniref:BMP family ABC transporter substrate-binding protein n=1 Tax=Pyrolobus fumarii TaxID=54252 RepID=UPI00064F7E99|nr:BMP family ABC transporter substrate-binding protein [Pyrolobus fumarii]